VGVGGGRWGVVGLVLGGAAAYLPLHFGFDSNWHTWFFILFALYLLATTAAAMKHHVITEALENSLISGGILTAMVVWLMVSNFSPMWVAERAAQAVAGEFKDGPPPVTAVAGFSEPSLVFLSGTGTVLTSGGGAAQHLLNESHAAAIVEGRELPAFTQALGGRAADVREAAQLSGINYSKGKPVTLHVFVRKPPAK